MSIKYLVMPGYVRSRHDNDMHYVGAAQLATLYGLTPGQWRVFSPSSDRHTTLPVLGPRSDGNYEWPLSSAPVVSAEGAN